MLIPIASDNDLSSVNLIIEKYNIKELPTIIIDEKQVISGVVTFEYVEKVIF